jgi:hypothetical protein
MATENISIVHCSFCNKSQRDVRRMIAGAAAYICDECAEICVDICAEPLKSEDSAEPSDVVQYSPLPIAFGCALCGSSTPDGFGVRLSSGRSLCAACAEDVEVPIEEARRGESGT